VILDAVFFFFFFYYYYYYYYVLRIAVVLGEYCVAPRRRRLPTLEERLILLLAPLAHRDGTWEKLNAAVSAPERLLRVLASGGREIRIPAHEWSILRR